MNAIAPAFAFGLAAERFDTHVANAFAASGATRHVRDRLIAQVDDGRLDAMLLRSRRGMEFLAEDVNRRAAINVIDFAFEPYVLPSMSTEQATTYLQAVETTLQVTEARGLDRPGPLWVDTVHHVCVFSVLFQLAAHLGKGHGYRQVILLHQGQRPEPRLKLVANLLRQVHGIALMTVQLNGNWFKRLAELTMPTTAIFYLTDMPPDAFPKAAHRRRAPSQMTLLALPDVSAPLETMSGSRTFARRLGANHVMLDYPARDRVRIRPFDSRPDLGAMCPVDDWLFWPLLKEVTGDAFAGAGSRH